MMRALQGKVSKVVFSDCLKDLLHSSHSSPSNPSPLPLPLLLRRFSSIDASSSTRGASRREDLANNSDLFSPSTEPDDDTYGRKSSSSCGGGSSSNPPNPIPNRPLRGEQRMNRPPPHIPQRKLGLPKDEGVDRASQASPFNQPSPAEKVGATLEDGFLERFKLGVQKKERPQESAAAQPSREQDANHGKEQPPQNADEIFRKMKESGLIPNAVAMLDGLCKDGLVQEAMKLFGLMREKGTIPEVVIYTAVVEGFCKARQLDDAVRIFRKMQNNGISPNAFSYTVLIRGMYKGNRLDIAVDFCVEMLEAGHSPNVATLVDLIHEFCKEKGVEEAKNVIVTLKQKGLFVDDKAVREYLDKKGPQSPLVWEAFFGKKSPQRSF